MLCQRLLTVRAQHLGYSQAEMAARLGISMARYQKYEQGKRRIPLDILALFSALTKVPLEYLMWGTTSGQLPARPVPAEAWALLSKEQKETLLEGGHAPDIIAPRPPDFFLANTAAVSRPQPQKRSPHR